MKSYCYWCVTENDYSPYYTIACTFPTKQHESCLFREKEEDESQCPLFLSYQSKEENVIEFLENWIKEKKGDEENDQERNT